MYKVLFFCLFAFSSCCAITSSCNCNPPPPALILEATAWISPYDSLDAITFIDPSGNIDTFSLQKFSDTESCGGDECSSDCQRETITFTLNNETNASLEIVATRNNFIHIIQSERILIQITASPLGWSNSPRNFEEDILNSVDESFSWNNTISTVVHISCNSSSECLGSTLKEITISEESGLIQYIDSQDQVWIRTE